jgi:ribosomal-protein-alanine N-acetyltransferase
MTPVSSQIFASIRLAPMHVDDLDTVLMIERLSFTTPWSRAMFVTELANSKMSRLIVACTDGEAGKIVGYLVFRIVIDEMHIILVAVHPNWRQRNIARQLLEHAMTQAREAACRKATLEVRASNVAAQRLYFQVGFAPVGTRPQYYRRPSEDALILWRDPL